MNSADLILLGILLVPTVLLVAWAVWLERKRWRGGK